MATYLYMLKYKKGFKKIFFLSSIQCCGSAFIESGYGYGSESSISSESGSRSKYGSGSRVLMTKNLRKKIPLKIFSFLFLIKNCNILFPRLPKERLSYRRSLQPSKEIIQIQHLKK
jgi:hypothetical protein